MYGDYGSHDDWDPMEEAYYNERFNSYEAGPGANLDRSLQPCFRKRNEIQRPLCKLFVHQIPRTLTEEGLRNLFLKFGNPRSVYLCPKPSSYNMFWALIEYSTVSEGQEAINALNGRPPLNLSVQFARSEEEKGKMRKQVEQDYLFRKMRYPLDSSYDLPDMESPYPRAIGRGRGVPMLMDVQESYYSTIPSWLSNDEVMFKKSIPGGVYAPYRGSVWDQANHHAIDEGSLTVNSSEDGRRISMGRGVPCIESKSRRLRNHKFALQRSDFDSNGLRIGLCIYCAEPSLFSCQRCGAWYCSEECQREDWLTHKEICMPYLCKRTDTSVAKAGVSQRTEVASEEKVNKESGSWKERKGGQERGSWKERKGGQERGSWKERKGGQESGSWKERKGGQERGSLNKESGSLIKERGSLNKECGSSKENKGWPKKAEGVPSGRIKKPELKNCRKGELGRNIQRREDEGQKKRDVESEGDGNKMTAFNCDNPQKNKDSSSPGMSSEPIEEKKTLSCEDSRKISEIVELPLEKFTTVTIVSVQSPGHYWVQSKDEEKDLISVMKMMNEMGKVREEAMDLKVGDFCSAMFEGFPYRAKVLSVKNNEANVFFVDFGNVDTCKLSDIGKLPSEAWNYKSQAIEVIMDDQTPQQFLSLSENEVVSVKSVSGEDTPRIVRVEGVKYEERPLKVGTLKKDVENNALSAGKVRMQWPKSVLELVKEGMLVVCDVFDIIEGDEDRIILGIAFDDVAKDLFSIFRDLPNRCSEMVFDPTFKPKVGDLVAGTTGDEQWLRGVILNEESIGWKVAFCDTGSLSVIKDLRKMPDDAKYTEAPAFAIQCKILKSFHPRKDLYSEDKIKLSSRLHLKIMACSEKEVVADMLTKDMELLCKVKLEAWRPEVSDLSCHILSDGDKVLIVSYFNTAAIYVQPADEMSQKNIQSLLQEVAGACSDDRRRMKEAPAKGTLVACKYSGDGNYYRALVMDLKQDNELFVSYVDFGNQEWVQLEKVRSLPDELRKIPCYAVKIGLRVSGISKLPLGAVRLLSTLTLNAEELKIVISDGDLRNCELITKSGVRLSDKIAELAEPSIKSSSTDSDGRIKWTPDMVGKLDIPEGGTSRMKFLILSCPGRCTVVGCPAEDPRMVHVYKTFPAEVTEYCEKCPQVPYVPVAYELCLAKYTDGMWYRAFAVDAKGDESQIYFVDFGDWMKVNHKDIRKMVPDFMKVPYIAVLCTYKGFEEETMSKEQEDALKQYLKPNTLFFASLSLGQGPDEYILDISEVTEALRSKNLIP